MNEPKNFVITRIISDQELPRYQEQRDKTLAENDIITCIEGVTAIPMQGPAGIGIMCIPHALIEYKCTKEEFDTWKFANKLKIEL